MELLECALLLNCVLYTYSHTAGQKPVKPVKPVSCSSSEFSCSDGQCVPHTWRCDHHSDCSDGSDEINCDMNECEVNNGGCSHVCLDRSWGFECDCPSGMRLVQDVQCEDVDPCLDADVCDQVCVQSNSSLTCECGDGYLRTRDSGRCRATGAPAGVLFSSSSGIIWMNSSGSDQNIWNSTGAAGPLTAFIANSAIYWTHPAHAGIYRLSLDDDDGVHTSEVLFKHTRGIMGLAVDWVNECLYWTSNITRAIHVSTLNGSEPTINTLLTGLNRPSALAVHPLLRLLFWVDGGISPRIESSSLDGTSRKALVTNFIQNPVSVSLDIPRGLLYWADSSLRTVSRITYDGQQRKTVVESNGFLDEPLGLAVFEDRVYWTDRLTGSVCSADKHSGKNLIVIQNSGTQSPSGLIIYHPLLQPTGTVQSSSEASVTDSAFPWIISLIVVLCVVLMVLLLYWWRSSSSSSSSLSLAGIGDTSLKESQDPLVPSTHSHTHMDKNCTNVDVVL